MPILILLLGLLAVPTHGCPKRLAKRSGHTPSNKLTQSAFPSLYPNTVSVVIKHKEVFLREGAWFVHAKVASRNRVRFLTFNFDLRSESFRSEHLCGKREFARIVSLFRGQFDYIEANWESWSDNYQLFEAALKAGVHYRQAAKLTWTGVQAVSQGFYDLRKIEHDRLNETVRAEFWPPTQQRRQRR